MKVRVEVDPNCKLEFGSRAPDRQLLIVEYLKAIRELFEATGGLPTGCREAFEEPEIGYVLDDADWCIGFTRSEQVEGLLRKTVLVRLFKIRLKK